MAWSVSNIKNYLAISTESLRYRIFLSMFAILLLSSLIILIITIFQYREESIDYNIKRLERKEKALKRNIGYVLKKTTYPVSTNQITNIFRDEIFMLSQIHNLDLELYDLEGRLLLSTFVDMSSDSVIYTIPPSIIDSLDARPDKSFRLFESISKGNYYSAYSYITDEKFKPVAILHIPYKKKEDFYQYEMNEFLKRIAGVYIFLILLAIIISFYLSKSIIRTLSVIGDKLRSMDILGKNKKIEVKKLPLELRPIVDAYNQMVDKLDESTRKLIQAEKESAWREMAKQIAHEIKNPLTPMKLSIQSLQYSFRPDDPAAGQKIKDFTEMMLEQIEAMDRIANTFSDFTKISELNIEDENIVDMVKNTAMLFPDYVEVQYPRDEIRLKLDKTKIKQALINILKNAVQALSETPEPQIIINVEEQSRFVRISIQDNGPGIPKELMDKIFDPYFTTKSGGTGLGLAIVKRIIESHGGSVEVEVKAGKGTKFIIILPKNK